MGEQKETESTRGDEAVTGKQEGSQGQQPASPRTQPDLDPLKKDDPDRKASDEEDLPTPEDPEADTAVKAPHQDDR